MVAPGHGPPSDPLALASPKPSRFKGGCGGEATFGSLRCEAPTSGNGGPKRGVPLKNVRKEAYSNEQGFHDNGCPEGNVVKPPKLLQNLLALRGFDNTPVAVGLRCFVRSPLPKEPPQIGGVDKDLKPSFGGGTLARGVSSGGETFGGSGGGFAPPLGGV
ncbi:hypothetical protein RRG08_003305 [Elysia crispata]|uniref:Uncharacterized protein n=1 Tax=Elysia crispata TaxID=231223 RepID=A0AAE0ZRS7_9GAST|nr:hypothetical protein RRG08_003305 [Elysia crispata]